MTTQDKSETTASKEDPLPSSNFVINIEKSSRGATDEDELNRKMLKHAVCEAGCWAQGIKAVEVWVWNDEGDVLEMPDGGSWRDSVVDPSEALAQLEDPSRHDYVAPDPLGPGLGLAGVLWAAADKNQHSNMLPMGLLKKNLAGRHDESNDAEHGPAFRNVVWRDIKAMANDPHQPPNERLRLLGQAGFGLAAGVSYNIRGNLGIVIYMARSNADLEKLQSDLNQEYLISAADLIAAQASLSHVRARAIRAKKEERQAAIRRAKLKLLVAIRFGMFKHAASVLDNNRGGENEMDSTGVPKYSKKISFQSIDESFRRSIVSLNKVKRSSSEKARKFLNSATRKCHKVIKKSHGLNVRPPPPFSNTQSSVTFIGVFLTLSVIGLTSVGVNHATTGRHQILMGPLAAMAMLQYGLTAAPAAQPRTAIYSQILSIAVALAISFIPVGSHASLFSIRQSFAVAVACALMVRLGLTHPPSAASAALVVASENFDIVDAVLLVFGCVVGVGMATVINNSSSRRQYPIYWAFFYGCEIFDCCSSGKQ